MGLAGLVFAAFRPRFFWLLGELSAVVVEVEDGVCSGFAWEEGWWVVLTF
jgi:hypothetical protein